MSVFWSVFSFIRTKYGEILIISPYSVQMHENKGRKNSEYGHFSRSAFFYIEIWDHFVLSKERRKGKKKESKTFFKLSVIKFFKNMLLRIKVKCLRKKKHLAAKTILCVSFFSEKKRTLSIYEVFPSLMDKSIFCSRSLLALSSCELFSFMWFIIWYLLHFFSDNLCYVRFYYLHIYFIFCTI